MATRTTSSIERVAAGMRATHGRNLRRTGLRHRSNAILQEPEVEEEYPEYLPEEESRPVPGPGPSTLAYIPHSSFASHATPTARPQQPLYHKAAEQQAEHDVEISVSREGTFKQRYKALQESTRALETTLGRRRKVQVTEKITERLPDLTESGLREFYGALLESGREEGIDPLRLEAPRQSTAKRLPYKRRKELLGVVATRLGVENQTPQAIERPSDSTSGSLARRLASLHASGEQSTPDAGVYLVSNPDTTAPDDSVQQDLQIMQISAERQSVPVRTRILARLAKMGNDTVNAVPLGTLSKTEWQAVIEDFIAHDNARGSEIAVALMKRYGTRPSEEQSVAYMELDAKRGRPREIKRAVDALENSGQLAPVPYHELYIRAHLAATPKNAQPAINHLRSREISGSPLSQSCYLVVLDHLLTPSFNHATNSRTHAMAWDLFTHLRLVAHPTPSAEMYTTMIIACANSANPQPERARDLWMEMTTEGNCVSPGREQYEAIIKALGSTKTGHLEAIGYLREMLAKHREVVALPFSGGEDRTAALASRFIPTHSTFLAALEGIKRNGDAHRARWVLAEVLRLAKAQGEAGLKEAPDEGMMAALFMTYAAWEPAISREAVRVNKAALEQQADSSVEAELQPPFEPLESDEPPPQVAELSSRADSSLNVTLPSDAASQSGPQSRADALREIKMLFDRILQDQASSAVSLDERPFQNVRVTPRLVNSFLSASFAHSASFRDIRQVWQSTWADVKQSSSSKPNGWSYLLALQRCAMAKPVVRPDALAWATELWEQYCQEAEAVNRSLANTDRDPSRINWLAGFGPRQIESTWAAMIRTSALCGDLAGSLKLLSEFREKYPPSDILKGYEPTPPSSFSIRMATPSTIAEPDVPPHLLFPDVSLVHHRLVREGDLISIGKVKWTCLTYERALEKRRAWRLKGAGERRVRAAHGDDVATQQLLN